MDEGRNALALVILAALGLWVVTRPFVWYWLAVLPYRLLRRRLGRRRRR